MALFTSVATGDFDADATWDVGSGYPGAADTFAIVATHTVTIPNALAANTTGNIDGSGTGTRGVLVIADGGSLQLTADMTLTNYNKLQLNGGSELDLNGFDVLTNTSASERNYLEFVGTSTNRVIVKSSVVGTGDIRRTTGDAVAGIQNIQYVDFLDCGTIRVGNNFNANMPFAIKRSVFDGCGETILGGFHHLAQDFEIENIDFRNDVSLTANIAIIRHTEVSSGAGTISITGITVAAGDNALIRYETENIDRSVIINDQVSDSSLIERGSDKVDSFTRMANAATCDTGGIDAYRRNYIVSENNNPKPNDKSIDVMDSCVLEMTYTVFYDDDGDLNIFSPTRSQSANNTLVIEAKSGVFQNALGDAKSGAYSGNNNTLVGNYDDYGALFRTESGGSITGTMDSYNNIVYSRTLTAGSRGYNFDAAVPAADQITNMDYNAWFNIDDKYFGLTSATKTPGVTTGYGGNDLVDVDPQFFDSTRTFAKWALLVTGTETVAAGVAHLLDGTNGYDSINRTQDPTLIVTDTPADAVAWVRAGYAPTNVLYEASGQGGVDIGAIPYQAAGGGSGSGPITSSTITSAAITSAALASNSI